MKFSEVLDALKDGERLTNSSLSAKRGFIVRQIPQDIPEDVVPKMTSLPQRAKDALDGYELSFKDQVLLIWWDSTKQRYIATSYIPNWYDIFREDWTIA